MKKFAICFILGGISICALPPFNGFVGEFLIYMSFIKALDINNFGVFIVILFALGSLALVGTVAILCFSKTDAIIANYNIKMYKTGQLTSLDKRMLLDLSDDAWEVLIKENVSGVVIPP